MAWRVALHNERGKRHARRITQGVSDEGQITNVRWTDVHVDTIRSNYLQKGRDHAFLAGKLQRDEINYDGTKHKAT